MFADLFFMTLLFIGLVAAIPATILIITGLIKKVRTTVFIGLFISIIPVVCIGLFCWFYYIYIPDTKTQNISEFSGKYQVELTNSYNKNKEKFDKNTYNMTLEADMTFKLDSTPGLDFWGTGTWDTDGADGQFRFFDSTGKLLNWTSPFGGKDGRKLIFNLYDDNEVRFVQTTEKK